jgi:predicted nucleic acid binding AN1-type Zn finger protein
MSRDSSPSVSVPSVQIVNVNVTQNRSRAPMVAPHESKTTHTRACTRATCAGAQPSVSSLASPPRSSAQRSRRVPPFFSFFSSDFHTRRIVEQDRTGPGAPGVRWLAPPTQTVCPPNSFSSFAFCVWVWRLEPRECDLSQKS